MKVKTSGLSGVALDWIVAYLEFNGEYRPIALPKYSTDWVQGGPIIEREDISVIRLENKSIPNDKGFCQGVYVNNWGAVIKTHHDWSTVYGPQGDDWGQCYSIDASDIVEGPTALIAAMRCYVTSKLGDVVDIPDELVGVTK